MSFWKLSADRNSFLRPFSVLLSADLNPFLSFVSVLFVSFCLRTAIATKIMICILGVERQQICAGGRLRGRPSALLDNICRRCEPPPPPLPRPSKVPPLPYTLLLPAFTPLPRIYSLFSVMFSPVRPACPLTVAYPLFSGVLPIHPPLPSRRERK